MNFPAVAAASLALLSVPSHRTVGAFRAISRDVVVIVARRSHHHRRFHPRHDITTSPSPSRRTTRDRSIVAMKNSSSASSSYFSSSPRDGETMYWNREYGASSSSSSSSRVDGKTHRANDQSPIAEARILALSDPNDPNNAPLYAGPLPPGCTLLGVGTSLEDFRRILRDGRDDVGEPNVIFVSHPTPRESLIDLLTAYPTVEWVHTRSAGVDHVVSDELSKTNVVLTNAKGMFSSTLAEYCMMACSYFAKDMPRLMRQKAACDWTQYPIMELRGSTMGIVGYGDIGRACARLAKAYGMTVLGLRRTASSSSSSSSVADPYCDRMYGTDGLHDMLSRSDYVLVAAPLTEQTRGLISYEALSHCKSSAVIINVGRGPIIDESALATALRNGKLRGAGLDVTTVEPLPRESPLWGLDNVLLSPHNMDMTRTFMRESTEFFVNVNLTRFVRGEALFNPVDKSSGY
jgi:phosphoglycerate dehydrogenase-like enzyme